MAGSVQLKKPVTQWLQVQLEQKQPGDVLSIMPLKGDASSRRYYRIQQNQQASLILMHAPDQLADHQAFACITDYWQRAEIAVPKILAQDAGRGLFLLQDLGNHLFLQSVQQALRQQNHQHLICLYRKALLLLIQMQQLDKPVHFILPDYSRALMLQEMQYFYDWLIQKWLDVQLTQEAKKNFTHAIHWLAETLVMQPCVWVHRDYHSRNLMLVGDQQLVTIDYQDAVWGPVSYDLVSLLRDCYVTLPDVVVQELIRMYLEILQQQQGILYDALHGFLQRFPKHFLKSSPQSEPHLFCYWFDLMGLQRHLKAAGIFARLHVRDHKSAYLSDIPRTLLYTIRIAAQYPETKSLAALLQDFILPRVVAGLHHKVSM